MKNTLTLKEISKLSYDALIKSGYSPKYSDYEGIEFDCNIDGVKFSFYTFDNELFGYSAEFKLKEELSTDEKERLERIYMQIGTDEIIFENFHIDGTYVWLSSAFACGCYPEDFISLSVKMLTNAEGIVSELKAKSYAWEPVDHDPKVEETVRKCYDILVERGYSSKGFYGHHQVFKFIIDGILFYFMWLAEDQVFSYCTDFDLKKKMSERERARLESLHAEMLPEGVTEEELKIDGKGAWLMGKFARDLTPEEMMEIVVREHTRTDGIVAELKAKSKSYLKERKNYEG